MTESKTQLLATKDDFKDFIQKLDMDYSYTFINDDLESWNTLCLEPSVMDHFFLLTYIKNLEIVGTTRNPIWYTEIVRYCDFLHFRISNTRVIISKSERIVENKRICEKNSKNDIKPDVYFIQSIIGGPIKIGVSIFPKYRLKDLQSFSPFELKILATIPNGGHEKENQLHKCYAKSRIHGEWFKPTPELLKERSTIKKADMEGDK